MVMRTLFFIISVFSAASTAVDAVRVSVSPSHVTNESAWVEVFYDGVPDSEFERNSTEYLCSQDSYCKETLNLSLWIGVFSENADLTPIGPQSWPCANPPWLATSPIKWKPLTRQNGSVSFFVERQRWGLDFVLFSNGTTYPIVIGKTSSPLTFERLDAPQHVHLSIASFSSDTVRVSWEARDVDPVAHLKIGTAPGTYTMSVSASPSTYVRDDLCGPPATAHGFYMPPNFYSAVVSVEPGRTYYYVVGSEASGYTAEYSFVGPTAPSSDATLRITALADMGETYIDGAQYHWMEPFSINTTNGAVHAWGTPGTTPLTMNPGPDASGRVAVAKSGKEGPPSGHTMQWLSSSLSSAPAERAVADVVVHIGDLSYATGYESEWDRFMKQIEPIARQVPYMTGQGNHERDYPGSGSAIGGGDSGGECGVPTQARFRMPTPSHRQDNGWYSFEQGPVHFVMMDTELAAFKNTLQYDFFESDLAAVNRSRTPWVIFMGHRPMYSSSDNATGLDIASGPWMPDIEDLLYAHQVDLALWGHVHNAEQTCPLYRGKCVQAETPGTYDAPVHAVIGNAGQSLTKFPETHPVWSLWRFSEFGYATIEVQGAKELTMRFWADADNGLVHKFSIQGKERG